MSKGNGKTEGKLHLESRNLKGEDLERELPAAEGEEESAPAEARRKPRKSARHRRRFGNGKTQGRARRAARPAGASAGGIRQCPQARGARTAGFSRIRRGRGHQESSADARQFRARAEGWQRDAGDFRNGIELIYRQFQDALQKIGVQPIVALGQPFDPRVHEAIEMVDTTEVPDHHVFDELQRGYKYKERLLRPAMVRVARNSRRHNRRIEIMLDARFAKPKFTDQEWGSFWPPTQNAIITKCSAWPARPPTLKSRALTASSR